jgi:hypothetical protein
VWPGGGAGELPIRKGWYDTRFVHPVTGIGWVEVRLWWAGDGHWRASNTSPKWSQIGRFRQWRGLSAPAR